ncbi:MAG: aldehyde dehydrogenase family protein [Acidobacteriaceae bacterium]
MNAAEKLAPSHDELLSLRAAQHGWRATPLRRRLAVVRRLRREIASAATDLAATVPANLPGALHRSLAETLTAEVLPLAEACRFLEKEAPQILESNLAGKRARPLWLSGVSVETRRLPLGIVLILAPANYPLFLPGVQVLQALVAGNAVLWKPAPGTSAPAHALRAMLVSSGLDPDLLLILSESPAAAQQAIRAGVDKVFLTGSAETGKAVLGQLAQTVTPSVMELSGCDAVLILPGADLNRAADAVAFGLRLNGSFTCMAPRRLFVTRENLQAFSNALLARLSDAAPVAVTPKTAALLGDLMTEATLYGAKILRNGLGDPAQTGTGTRLCSPTLLTEARPSMRITCADIFAPVASIIPMDSPSDAARLHSECRYRLTAAIFGPTRQAENLAAQLDCGTILLNDVIVSTADPRVCFGGRALSGFGVTRGPEGLLEMTAPQTVIRNRSRNPLPYQPVTPAHAPFFAAGIRLFHGGWKRLPSSLRAVVRAARKRKAQ